MPGKDGIEIHLFQNHGSIRNSQPGYELQILNQVLRILAPVRFDQPDHHVDALLPHQVGILEHLESLANAGRCADIDAQLRLFGSGRSDVGREFCHVPREDESIR